MPTFSTSVDFEFEVYCDNCGTGCCGNTDVVETRTRRMPSIRVSCPTCASKIKELEKEIDSLNTLLEELRDRE